MHQQQDNSRPLKSTECPPGGRISVVCQADRELLVTPSADYLGWRTSPNASVNVCNTPCHIRKQPCQQPYTILSIQYWYQLIQLCYGWYKLKTVLKETRLISTQNSDNWFQNKFPDYIGTKRQLLWRQKRCSCNMYLSKTTRTTNQRR